ncbi:MAG TPA: hypothetical protein VHH73_10365 [Verrucomicrobiae bacterium]|nr:hypothetical protein [Verrucomicrobiae bacterium]
MIGIGPDQTLRLNVSHVGLPGDRATPPDPCRVEVSFFDNAGNLLVPAVQKILASGVSAHFDLDGNNVVTRDLLHRGVRPVVHIIAAATAAANVALPPGPCVTSVELIDKQSGRTLISASPEKPGEINGFNPQPDPPGFVGLVGFGPGQTARLNAVNVEQPGRPLFPPGPCKVTLVFFGEDGKLLAHNVATIKPGEATSLDISFPTPTDTTAAAGDGSVRPTRVAVRGVMLVDTPNSRLTPPDPCRMTLEVFDASGNTATFLSP